MIGRPMADSREPTTTITAAAATTEEIIALFRSDPGIFKKGRKTKLSAMLH